MIDQYKAYAKQRAEAMGVPWQLYERQIQQESGWNQSALSPKGARGLGQLMPGTAKQLGVDSNDWRQNIDGSLDYLKQQYDTFGSWRLALAAYNAGPGNVRKYGGDVPPFEETRNYVNLIMGDGDLPRGRSTGATGSGTTGTSATGSGGYAPEGYEQGPQADPKTDQQALMNIFAGLMDQQDDTAAQEKMAQQIQLAESMKKMNEQERVQREFSRRDRSGIGELREALSSFGRDDEQEAPFGYGGVRRKPSERGFG